MQKGRSDKRSGSAPYLARRPNRASRALVPALLLLVFGFIVAYHEIPALAQWWERLAEPQAWKAKQMCQQAALSEVARPAFARVLEPGEVHSTQDGLYVEGLMLGEMSETGAEQAVAYSCYLDSAGELVRVNRLQDG